MSVYSRLTSTWGFDGNAGGQGGGVGKKLGGGDAANWPDQSDQNFSFCINGRSCPGFMKI